MNEERIKKLESQVQELLAWKEARTRQQITFPLDINSEDTLKNRGFLVFSNKSTSTISADKSIKVNIAGQDYQINVL